MTIQRNDEGWRAVAVEAQNGEPAREFLMQNYKTDTLKESAEAAVIFARVAHEHGLDTNVYCSVDVGRLMIILRNYGEGEVEQPYFTLAAAIDTAFGLGEGTFIESNE